MPVLLLGGLATLLFASGLSAVNPNATRNAVQQCCKTLEEQFGGEQLAWNYDTRYPSLNERYSDTASLNATCIFLPASAEEISTAVRNFAVNGGNLTNPCRFAINAGGNAPQPGANDLDYGVTLDLRWINSTFISADRSSVQLGTGSNWSTVYSRLDGTGLGVPGGDPFIGVGGMAVGGGFSWFTPKAGILVDNVANYEIVLASGEVMNASATNNSDLFLALKGGANNFGIVTRIDVCPFAQSDVWGGVVETSSVLTAVQEFTAKNEQDPGSTLLVEFNVDGATFGGSIRAFIVDTDDDLDDHPALSSILNISPINQSTLGTSSVAKFDSRPLPPTHRTLLATVTFQNDLTAIEAVDDFTRDLIYVHGGQIENLTWTYGYQPLPHFYLTQGSYAGNVLGLNDTDKDLIVMYLNSHWVHDKDDAAVNDAVSAWLKTIQEFVNTGDKGFPFEYIGYASAEQYPLASYGEQNLQFMKDVAKKYDPSGVFQTLVPGGFKLSANGGM